MNLRRRPLLLEILIESIARLEQPQIEQIPELIKQQLDTHRQLYQGYHPERSLDWREKSPEASKLEQAMNRARWHIWDLARKHGGAVSDYVERGEDEPFDRFEGRILHLHAPSSPVYHQRGEGNATIHFADRGFPARYAETMIHKNARRVGANERIHPTETDLPPAKDQAAAFEDMWRRAGGRVQRGEQALRPPRHRNTASLDLLYPRSYWRTRRGARK